MKLVITYLHPSRAEESFDMLLNIQPRGSRLMVRPAESTGRIVVRTGIAAILSIVALLKNDPSPVSIYEVIEVKTENLCTYASIDLNKAIHLMVSDIVEPKSNKNIKS